MEGITLQLRFDGESAELFTNQLLAFAEKQVKEQLENDRMPINQQALMEKFGFTHGYIKKLERKGLRFRKQGKYIMHAGFCLKNPRNLGVLSRLRLV